uniref:Uncharacterized protein n=1 Tax=Parascaris univalens TaxID=6257 RepID=A0A915CGZ3_PARUN
MSKQGWDDLVSSISGLRTAVVVLAVVIVLFCILQIISLIYEAIMMRRSSQKRKEEQMRRVIAAGRKRKRRASRSSNRRRNIPKYERSNDAEPSKKATIRLSLSREDDQAVESRKSTNEQVERKKKKSHSLSEGSLTVDAALPSRRRDNVPPESTDRKGNAELPSTKKDAPPQAANIDRSASSGVDKSDEKKPKAREPRQEVKRTDDQATNLVGKDSALVISDDQKPLPVEKDIGGVFVISKFVPSENRCALVQRVNAEECLTLTSQRATDGKKRNRSCKDEQHAIYGPFSSDMHFIRRTVIYSSKMDPKERLINAAGDHRKRRTTK